MGTDRQIGLLTPEQMVRRAAELQGEAPNIAALLRDKRIQNLACFDQVKLLRAALAELEAEVARLRADTATLDENETNRVRRLMRATLTATLQPGRGAVGNFAGETAAIWRERLAAAQAALAERDAVLAEAREALMAHLETFIAAGAMPFDDDVLLGMTDAALARIDALKGETDV